MTKEDLARFVELQEIIKAAIEELGPMKEAIKNEMRPKIGKALGKKSIDVDGFSVSISAFEKTSISAAKLRADHPAIAEEVTVTRTEVRVSVKAPKRRAVLEDAA